MKNLLLIFALLLTGCSSSKRLRGNEAQNISGQDKEEVKVSAVYDKELSQEGYHLIRFYFLNLKDQWQRIKNIQLVEVSGIEDFHLIQDKDLPAWKKSMLLDYDLKLEEAKKDKKKAPSTKIKDKLNSLSEDNALTEPLSLPGKLQVERWALIQTPGKNKLHDLTIEVNYIDSTTVQYKVLVEGVSQ